MSETTPTKILDAFTPAWYSPTSKSTTSDSNVAACKARLEIIVKTTLEHHHKWGLADKRGLQLCMHIESIKTKLIEQMNSTINSNDFTLYPKSMKQYCDNLMTIASICNDISLKTKESVRQLKALSKLPGSCNEIFYRSWQLPNFVEFISELSDRYEKEAKIKQTVAENLPHCTNRSDLIRWTSLWEYPQNIDSYVHFLFAFIKEELDNKN